MKNAVIAQSGGPTSAINATLAGVIRGLLGKCENIYGSLNGIEGILKENIISLNEFENEEKFRLLCQTPAAYLGSCRYKLKADDYDTFDIIFRVFEKFNIGYFFYIGGNDSMNTVLRLSDYAKEKNIDVKIMGIPKTIDNDLPVTDHTPGFGSAAKYIAATTKQVALDAMVYETNSVTIIEIMGRHAGWLTAASILARDEDVKAPHLIYLPEKAFDTEEFIEDVRKAVSEYRNIIVCVSEGIKSSDGTFVCEEASSGLFDAFGHKNLSGTGKVLENLVREKLGYKVRSVELNVCQRCASHILSKTDIEESLMIGEKGAECALSGETGKMVAFERVSQNPYRTEIISTDIKNTANLEKCVPLEWILSAEELSKEAYDYLRPLIEGEMNIIYKNSLPASIVVKK